jgi:hypothetical protein
MIAQSISISALSRFTRRRILPGNGHLLVREGQKVKYSDTVAEGATLGNFQRLDARRALGIASLEKLNRTFQHKVGDLLQKGDIIAQSRGIASRILRAPAEARIIAIDDGKLLLELNPTINELKAGYNGTIIETIPDRGVLIECDGALVQGVWGNGKIDGGVLSIALVKPDGEFLRNVLDVSMRGSMCLGGYCLQEDALVAAQELPLRGLLLAGLSSKLIPLVKTLPFPVLVLEGFGKVGLAQSTYKLLTSNDKREVCVLAQEWDVYAGTRPELFIPLPSAGSTTPEAFELQVGNKVRITMPPLIGKSASVLQVFKEPQKLQSGMYTFSAEVSLETGQHVTLPVSNLEIIH